MEKQVQAHTKKLQEQADKELLLAKIALRIRQSLNLEEILNATVVQVRQLLACDRVVVYRYQPGEDGVAIAESVSCGWDSLLGKTFPSSCVAPAWVESCTNSGVRAVSDIYTAGMASHYIELLTQLQIRAELSIPIEQGEQLWGWLTAYQCSAPREWQTWEIDWLEQLTPQLASAIQNSTLVERLQAELALAKQEQAALQTARDELELKLQERTAQLKQASEQLQHEVAANQRAEKALQQTKEQLEAVLNAIPGCVSWISSDLHYLGVNSRLAALCNLSREDFAGQKVGFLKSHYEFAEYVRQFFASSDEEASVEINVDEDGNPRTHLIAVRKYHQNQAAVLVGIDVSNHRLAEQALFRSAATNRALLNAIPDLMFRIKRNGTLVNYKAPKDSALLAREHEFIGKKVDEVMPKEAAQAILHCIEQAFKTGEVQVFEYTFPHNDSTSYWEARFACSGDDEVMAIVRDITKRKQAEEALQQSREFLRNVLDTNPNLIFVRDLDGRFTLVNQAVADIYGTTVEDLIGRTDAEFHPNHAEVEQYVQNDRQVAHSLQSNLTFEETFTTSQGEVRWFHTIKKTLLSPDGRASYVLGVANDITERKQAVEALRESEQRFRQMAENIREVFWMTDLDKKQMIYVSPAYEEIWGRTCESLYQHPQSFVDSIHPDDRDRVVAALKKQSAGEYDQEYRIVQPGGEQRWIRDRAFPIYDSEGQLYRLVGIAEDITQNKRVQQEVLKALEKEKELNELKSRFVSMTSHEFRTPLTTILGSAELLKYYSHKWSEEKKLLHFERIHSNVQYLKQMLDDLLLIGKAESGRLEFNPALLDVVQFCRNLVEELQVSERNQHAIIFTKQGQCTDAYMDEKLLRHVLSNLLSNAIKYSPPGSTVRFKLTIRDGEAMFQIQDQGIGIPKEDQERLFEPFHRAQNVGQISGTGLGLAIVKKTVDLQGGKITVNSEVGIGTIFTVTIPYNRMTRKSDESCSSLGEI
jgi:PAS domain S-box-containing protein